MRKIDAYLYITIASLMVAFTFQSCSSEDESENEWMANYVYLQKEEYLIPDKIFHLVHEPLKISGAEVTAKYVIKLKQAIQQDVQVTLDVKGGEIPADVITVSSKQVTIKAGEMISTPIVVGVADWSFAQQDAAARTYEVKIVIGSIHTQNKSLKISEYQREKIIRADKTERSLVALTKPDSWIAFERTKWTATGSRCYDGAEEYFGAQLALDNDIQSAWAPDDTKDAWWAVAFDKPVRADGFSFHYAVGGTQVMNTTLIHKVEYKKSGDTEWTTISTAYSFKDFKTNPVQYGFFDFTLDGITELRIFPTADRFIPGFNFIEFNLYKYQ